MSEAATGGVLLEKVFLEISQNTGKHRARVSFLTKLQVLGNILFTHHLWAAASKNYI